MDKYSHAYVHFSDYRKLQFVITVSTMSISWINIHFKNIFKTLISSKNRFN